MEPAYSIVKRLGGEMVVSQVCQTSPTTPYNWQYKRERGGTGGTIPQRYHRTLLDYARRHDIPLAAEDFLPQEAAA